MRTEWLRCASISAAPGRSGGSYDNGIGEQEDALAALQALATGAVADELPNEMRVGLAGYSFGGGVALGAARGAVGLAASGVDLSGHRR